MSTHAIDRSGTHKSDDVGLAMARLFAGAAGRADPINCAKQIEAGAKLRQAKERKREKAREARRRKKAALPIAKAIAARNATQRGDGLEIGDVEPQYREFLAHLLRTMFGDLKIGEQLGKPGIPIRIAAETVKASAGEHAPVFRTALRLVTVEDNQNDQVAEQKILAKRCTAKIVQVGPEPNWKELEELRSSSGCITTGYKGNEMLHVSVQT